MSAPPGPKVWASGSWCGATRWSTPCLPILTVSGTTFGALLGGSVAVERAFGVPGLGLALVFAIAERDWMLIQNLVLLYGVIFVLINLVVDISYGWFDPRIRYQ